MKLRPLAPLLPLLLVLSACGPSPHEQELQTQLEQANARLAQAEAKAAGLQSQLGVRDTDLAAATHNLEEAKTQIAIYESEANAARIRNEMPKPQEDKQYIVVKRQYTPGKFITVRTPEGKEETKKVEPIYELTFRGVQTGKVYPVLQVKDTIYSQFKEGVNYTRDDVSQASK